MQHQENSDKSLFSALLDNLVPGKKPDGISLSKYYVRYIEFVDNFIFCTEFASPEEWQHELIKKRKREIAQLFFKELCSECKPIVNSTSDGVKQYLQNMGREKDKIIFTIPSVFEELIEQISNEQGGKEKFDSYLVELRPLMPEFNAEQTRIVETYSTRLQQAASRFTPCCSM